MIRPQTLLLILVIVLVVIWVAAQTDETSDTPTPEPTSVALVATEVTVLPTSTHTLEPTPSPTLEPTATDTPEPTETPEPVRPDPPDLGGDGEAVIIDRGDSGRLEVAFTFDAGEGAGYTEEILDLLAKYNVKASFGVTGQWAEQNPELLQRIVDEGHMLINHTYDHQSFTGVSPGTDGLTDDERAQEVEQTGEIILDITSYETAPYFRFPYNDYDLESLELLDEIGYGIIAGYTCDSLGWYGLTADEIVERCGIESQYGGEGAVILMHVVQEQDFLALETLIQEYQNAGYDGVTFEQLIQP